ncbi:tyrosine-type recombinase/integrase [Pectobacterium sp. B2J-2]|uniref:tyrosine-type recombinase/integrase n=1 Tax=Pectobacterium sp. B2J-2 TaxID=3385372 RepID=UPI0038FBED41
MSVTYEDIIQDYFFSKPLRPATEVSYRKVLNLFLRFTGENVLPADVDRHTVLSWRRHLLNERQLSSITWNNRVAHMRAIFNHAMKYNFVQMKENPFNSVVARPDVKRKKTLSEEQIRKIYLAMEAREEKEFEDCDFRSALRPAWFWLTVIDTLRFTGMRQNQLLHIRLGDVNLDEGWINLRPEASKNHKEHIVPITTLLRPRLERLYNAALNQDAKMGDQLFNVHLFKGRKSNMAKTMAPPPIRAFFRRLSVECRCTISPHRFRHTIATEMMKSPDRNLKIVQSLLGHSTVNVTLEYVEGNMDIVRNALEQEFGRKGGRCSGTV